MLKYKTGDTIRLVGTFRDWASTEDVATAALIDPDSVVVNIYKLNGVIVSEDNATVRDSVGVYHFDWTTPADSGEYVVEFYGVEDTLPIVNRTKILLAFA